jgi:hypothetical protein
MPVFSSASGHEIKRAKISVAAAATGEIVAAQGAGEVVVLIGYVLTLTGAAGSVEWKSDTTAVSGVMGLVENGAYSADSRYGLCETAANKPLKLSAVGGAAEGMATYVVVRDV